MQDFLYNKFSNLNTDSLAEFQGQINDWLPSFNSPVKDDFKTSIWGRNGGDFWTVNREYGQYFEESGVIHFVGFNCNEQYYTAYNYLYEASLTSRACKMSQAVAFEQSVLDVAGHGSGHPIGTPIYYIKYQTPDNTYGAPFTLDILVDPNYDIEGYLRRFVDEITWIFATLKQGQFLLPEWITFDLRLRNRFGIFYTRLTDLTLSPGDAVTSYLTMMGELLDVILTRKSDLDAGIKESILSYARDKWQPLAN